MIKAYASYFVSYLIANLNKKDLSNLKAIILFGSAAREEATKESDIDIFIDIKKDQKNLNKKVDEITNNYYKSREALLFKTKGIDNKINIVIGKIDKWKDLKKSIESNGIYLYSFYVSTKMEGKKKALIFWNKIKRNRGAFLNKIYGFKVKDKKYRGLLEEFQGEKLGKSTILIPIEYREDLIKVLKYYGVNARIIEVYA
ncbi:nucleotidyltransferase domain-containing protein [Candidatus Pacearchaeota archaeon]|nr:nucleotidyltransferase domain-containing protein [Candidatus Pacearchaeota archaeon]